MSELASEAFVHERSTGRPKRRLLVRIKEYNGKAVSQCKSSTHLMMNICCIFVVR